MRRRGRRRRQRNDDGHVDDSGRRLHGRCQITRVIGVK
jgi:hypothetical protein